jgi:hypothetical protein
MARAEMDLLLVDGLHELPYYQGYTLDALDFLLCPDQLALQAPLLILDVFLLQVDVPATVSHW